MDLFSVLDTVAGVVKAVDDHRTSNNDVEESIKSLKTELDSIRKLLTQLVDIVTGGEERLQGGAQSDSDRDRDDSILALVDGEGQLGELRSTLDEISAWLLTLQSKPRNKMTLDWLSSKAKQRKATIEQFSSKLERYKSTASLVLAMAVRYEHN